MDLRRNDPRDAAGETPVGSLKLFVSGGESPENQAVIARLQELQRRHFPVHDIDVTDVDAEPEVATAYRISVTPTLIIESEKAHRIVGDLRDAEMVLGLLGMYP